MSVNSRPSIRKQKGLALLILIVVIALAFVTYTISGLSITEVKVEQIKNTQIALQKAKNALIAYAVNYPKNHAPRGPGYLLCPDTDNDGKGETGCNGSFTVGRLPWRTLNIGDIRDSNNERLWYAVSENFDYTGSPHTGALSRKIINTSTRGNVTVRDSNNNIIYDGTTIDAAIAVIIAPGEILTRAGSTTEQNRSDVNNAINFLDINGIGGEDNADFEQGSLGATNNNGFIQGDIFDASGNLIVNDIIEVITYRDLMGEVHKRVSKEISSLVNDYFTACGAYPEASVFDPAKSGLFDSAGEVATSTIGAELRKGHLPLDTSLPVNWGDTCTPAFIVPFRAAPVPATWLSEEEWHKVSYYEFAYTNPEFPSPITPPLASGTACTVGTDCLTVDAVNNISALIMLSGRELAIQDRVNTPLSVLDYYEGNNSDLDDDYDTDESEDYIKVITP